MCLRTRRAAAEFLRSARYPLFGKPVYGRLGGGTALIEGYDSRRDILRLHGGGAELVEAFVERVALRYAAATSSPSWTTRAASSGAPSSGGGRRARPPTCGPGEYVRTHPDTGREIVGTRVPQWNRARALVLAASKTLPRIRYQRWDIALTAQGPVAVELNYNGHVTQPGQLRGFHDPELRAFLARYGRR